MSQMDYTVIVRVLGFVSIIIFLLVSCDKRIDNELNLTYSCFKNSLTSQMDYTAILKVFGKPTTEIGDGILVVYIYELEDRTEMWIGCADQVLYARHFDKNHNLLHSIIENESISCH
jgi:hypothetical protein